MGIVPHTPETKERALLELAKAGSARGAATNLAAQGIHIDRVTLGRWRNEDPERWQRIQKNYAGEIEHLMVDDMKGAIRQAQEVYTAAMELELERIERGEVKDASGVAQRAAVAAGIWTDKLLVLSGKPTSIVQHQNADKILETLQRKFPSLIVSEPIVDAVVVEPEQLEAGETK